MSLSIFAIRILVTVSLGVMLALGGSAIYMWVGAQVKQLKINQLKSEKISLEAERVYCETARLSIVKEFDALSAELTVIADRSRERMEEATEIVGRSEAELERYERDLQELRKTWPTGCVEAAELVRQRRGL